MKYLNTFKLFESDQEPDYLTEEENVALKAIYLMVRDITLAFKQQFKSTYDKLNKNDSLERAYKSFLDKFIIPDKYKNSVGLEKTRYALDKVFIVDLDKLNPAIRKGLPHLFEKADRKFQLQIGNPNDENGAACSGSGTIYVGIKKLMDFPEIAYKSSLQHEVQHLLNIKKEQGQGQDRPDETADYFYLLKKSEIDSHAKQFAYVYSKCFPGQEYKRENLLSDKFDLVQRSKKKLNLYLRMCWHSDQLKDEVDDETFNKIKERKDIFPKRFKYYIDLFNRNPKLKPTWSASQIQGIVNFFKGKEYMQFFGNVDKKILNDFISDIKKLNIDPKQDFDTPGKKDWLIKLAVELNKRLGTKN